MNKHSYLSTQLVDLNNIKMYTVDKQYKNRRHIGLNAKHFNTTANVTAAGNMKSSQVTFIYIAPLTIQIVTKHCTISK